MDCLGKIRVNDDRTGKLLFSKKVIFECKECKSKRQFEHAHGVDVDEYLHSLIPDELTNGKRHFLVHYDLIELEDVDEEKGEDEEEIECAEEGEEEEESEGEYESIERIALDEYEEDE